MLFQLWKQLSSHPSEKLGVGPRPKTRAPVTCDFVVGVSWDGNHEKRGSHPAKDDSSKRLYPSDSGKRVGRK